MIKRHIRPVIFLVLFDLILLFVFASDAPTQNDKSKIFDTKKLISISKKWETPDNPFLDLSKSPTLTLSDDNLLLTTQHFAQKIFNANTTDSTTLNSTILQHIEPTILFATVVINQKKEFYKVSGLGFYDAFNKLSHLIKSKTIDAIQVDVFKDIIPKKQQLKLLKSENHLGLYGIIFGQNPQRIALPSDILFNSQSLKNISAETAKEITLFKTQSYYLTPNSVTPLYRGHRIIQELTPQILSESIVLATNYLAQHIRPSGKFDYILNPSTGSIPKKYNLVRHAGTLYAMIDAYQLHHNAELLEKIKTGLTFLLTKTAPCPSEGNRLCVIEDNKVKLGGNALALLAMAKYTQTTNDRQFLEAMQKLALAIVAMQETNGHFISDWDIKTWKSTGFVSEYYPGEATLALVELYKIDANPLWLETATRATNYIALTRDINLTPKNIIHDHWMLLAINQLYRLNPQQHFLEHAKKVVLGIQQAQLKNSEFLDYNGGYYNPPRSTPAAVRTEGLLAAYHLFYDANDIEFAKTILETVEMNLKFQLQTQIFTENTLNFKQINMGLGGFQKSVTDSEIRIDYVQHNLSGVIAYLKIFKSDQ